MAVEKAGKGFEEELEKTFPGRGLQLRLLLDMLGRPGQPSPTQLHLYDPNTPTATLHLLLKVLASPIVTVTVDPLVCPTSRSLYTHIWDTLRKLDVAAVPLIVDDSIDVFLGALSTWVEALKEQDRKLVLIIPRAERMRDIWPEPVMEALYNISELLNAKGFLTLVTISTLPVSNFRTTRGIGLVDAIVVTFPRLAKEDALMSLSTDAKVLIHSDKRCTTFEEILLRLHSTFIGVVYDSFASEVRDLEEIRLLACCVWYPFVEPLLQGVVPASRAQTLLSRSSYLFRDALTRLFTRESAPEEWVQQMVEHVKSECQAEIKRNSLTVQRPQIASKAILLPLIPSFLLLSSFLASYNPSRLDVRFFVRDESSLIPEASRNGSLAKKRKKAIRRGDDSNRQEMLGPKNFTLDRLLSIFQALMTEAGPELDVWAGEEESQVKSDWWEIKSKSVGVMDGINTLIRINALVRTSASEKLDSTILLRTNVTFETASQVSHRVRFDLSEWLYSWS